MSYLNDTANPQQDNQPSDFVSQIVKEKGEQWSDPQVLAKGYTSAQEYIKDLERQTAELRQDLDKQNYSETLLQELRSGQAQPSTGEPESGAGQQDSGASERNTTSTFSEDDLKKLINQTLTQTEQDNSRKQNLEKADQRLTELFGTEVEAEMNKRSREVGMSREQLINIASESPTAFFRLIGEQRPQTSNPVARGTLNTAAGFNDRTPERDWSYYQQMRREKPSQYYRPEIQRQLLEDKLRMGDSFGNT